jgi:hypothetical protein
MTTIRAATVISESAHIIDIIRCPRNLAVHWGWSYQTSDVPHEWGCFILDTFHWWISFLYDVVRHPNYSLKSGTLWCIVHLYLILSHSMVDGDVQCSPGKIAGQRRVTQTADPSLWLPPEPLDSLHHRLLHCHIRPIQCEVCPCGSDSFEGLYASTSMPSTLHLCNMNPSQYDLMSGHHIE